MSKISDHIPSVFAGGNRLTPKEFLQTLGVRKYSSCNACDAVTLRIFGGVNPYVDLERHDERFLSPAYYDHIYQTEERAQHSESIDYARNLSLLNAIGSGFPVDPKTIVDLGGGTGLVAMWLAAKYPTSQVIVYDFAEGPQMIGRAWAERVGLNNIKYENVDYQTLSRAGLRNVDLVIASYACSKTEIGVHGLVDAIHGLLNNEGVAVITAGFSPLFVRSLVGRARSVGLGVDWNYTYAEGTEDKKSIKNSQIFLRYDAVEFHTQVNDDVQAFFASAKYSSGEEQLTELTASALAGLFSDGKEWFTLSIEGTKGEKIFQRYVTKEGLLFFSYEIQGELMHASLLSDGQLISYVLKNMRILGSQARDGRFKKVEVAVSPEFDHILVKCGESNPDAKEIRDIQRLFQCSRSVV